jgi:uncharacterized Zn-finger protein
MKPSLSPAPISITVPNNSKHFALSCPMPNMGVVSWSSHPKVYLPVDADGLASCPYCGTKYILNSTTKT